jgi:hypothetical protein
MKGRGRVSGSFEEESMSRAFSYAVLTQVVLTLAVACGEDSQPSSVAANGGSAGSAGSTGHFGGSAGNGGAGTVPNEEAQTACRDYCNKAVALMCSADDTVDACMVGCNLMVQQCGAVTVAWLNCARNATLACDANGDPMPAGCESEQTALDGCSNAT